MSGTSRVEEGHPVAGCGLWFTGRTLTPDQRRLLWFAATVKSLVVAGGHRLVPGWSTAGASTPGPTGRSTRSIPTRRQSARTAHSCTDLRWPRSSASSDTCRGRCSWWAGPGCSSPTYAWMTQRYALVLLGLFPPAILELINGNIHLLLAAAIALGFRYPWTWSFVLLTKVTPGIGLVWFAVRREWRPWPSRWAPRRPSPRCRSCMAPWMWREWIDTAHRRGRQASVGARPSPSRSRVRLPVALLVVVLGRPHRPALDRAGRGLPGRPRHVVVQQRDAAGHHPHPADAPAGTRQRRATPHRPHQTPPQVTPAPLTP